MRYLHTMVRVADLDASLDFYCHKLGLVEVSRVENERGRFTLVFLCAPDDVEDAKAKKAPMVELTFNWDPEDYAGGRNFWGLHTGLNRLNGTAKPALASFRKAALSLR